MEKEDANETGVASAIPEVKKLTMAELMALGDDDVDTTNSKKKTDYDFVPRNDFMHSNRIQGEYGTKMRIKP